MGGAVGIFFPCSVNGRLSCLNLRNTLVPLIYDIGNANCRLWYQLAWFVISGAINFLEKCQSIRAKIMYKYHRELAEVNDSLAKCFAGIG